MLSVAQAFFGGALGAGCLLLVGVGWWQHRRNRQRAAYDAELAADRRRREERAATLVHESDELRAELAAAHAARATAEAANEAKSGFLAMVSHDLRTPVSAMIGSTELLLRTAPRPDQRELLETLQAAGTSLLQILEDSLDLARVEAGRLELERAPFRLRDAVEEALDLCALPAAAKALDLLYWLSPDLPLTWHGDVARFRQILVNLVGNAVKFTATGEIEVRVGWSDARRGELRVEVRDTGPGVPADHLDAIFDAFSQAGGSPARRLGGTGLGLAICRRLVEAMGGRIGVESAVGSGSTFRFFLPRNEASSAAGSEFETQGGGALSRRLARRQMLIIAGSESLRRCLVAMAEALGLSATAGDLELLDAPREEPWDLVLLETRLASSARVTLELGGRPAGQRPALVLLMTGLRSRAAARGQGGLPSVRLPVRLERFQSVLEAALQQGAPEVAPAAEAKPPKHRPRRGPRVLLAEDDPLNQTVALRMLSLLGCDTDLATDGDEALRALLAEPYDVALLDLQLPELSGLEVARRALAGLPAGRRPRLVALTASTQAADREACRQAGMADFLAKPLRFEALEQAIGLAVAASSRGPAPSVADDSVTLDDSRLASLRSLGERSGVDLVASVVSRFLQEVDERCAQLQNHFEQGATEDLMFYAHSLRGSSAQLGAARFAALCAELETLAREGNPGERGRAIFTELTDELGRLKPRLAEYLGQPAASPAP